MLIVRDTRESGPDARGGARGRDRRRRAATRCSRGVLPTPAASILVRRLGLDLAAVVSASHNPWRDNGIKFFGRRRAQARRRGRGSGSRRAVARPAAEPGAGGRPGPRARGRARRLPARARAALPARPLRTRASCSTAPTAPPTAPRRRSSSGSGAEVEAIGVEPDGRNINEGCGSTHPERAGRARRRRRAPTIGFAFDGDGDRVSRSTPSGAVRDGDELIALVAAHLAGRGELDGGVAVTVMTNYGFHQAMEEAGIEVATTPVGDRHVLARARAARLDARRRAVGPHHLDRLRADRRRDRRGAARDAGARRPRPRARRSRCEKLPQMLENVEVADRDAVERRDARSGRRSSARATALEGRGRVLVRPSGTEPLVRVMVEAPTEEECEAVCARLVEVVDRAASSALEPRRTARVGRSTLIASHVRNRRIRGQAALPRPADRRPREARVPRLRLGRHLAARGRRDRQRCARSATSPTCAPRSAWTPNGGEDGASRSRRRRRRSASPTPAGRPTAGSPRRTPTRTATATDSVHIVLNGIVENHAELRRELEADGPRVQLRDRRRDRRPPDRAALRRRPDRGRPRARSPSCAATTRSSPCTPTIPTRWSPPARSAR